MSGTIESDYLTMSLLLAYLGYTAGKGNFFRHENALASSQEVGIVYLTIPISKFSVHNTIVVSV